MSNNMLSDAHLVDSDPYLPVDDAGVPDACGNCQRPEATRATTEVNSTHPWVDGEEDKERFILPAWIRWSALALLLVIIGLSVACMFICSCVLHDIPIYRQQRSGRVAGEASDATTSVMMCLFILITIESAVCLTAAVVGASVVVLAPEKVEIVPACRAAWSPVSSCSWPLLSPPLGCSTARTGSRSVPLPGAVRRAA